MRGWKRVLALALCLCLIQLPAAPGVSMAAQAAGKSGLFKEGGKFYYYSNDKKIVNSWKKVRVRTAGKNVKYSFYFGSDGAACAGKTNADGTLALAKKTIRGKTYGFDQLGHMLTGVYVSKGKFYVFNSGTGVLDRKSSKKLRAAAKEGTAYATLIDLLARLDCKPQEVKQGLSTSYGNGTGNIYVYTGFEVHVFKDAASGKMTIMTVAATPLANANVQQGTETETGTEVQAVDALLRKSGGKYYCSNSKGETVKNEWRTIGGYRYYFTADGSAQTGVARIDGKLYLFSKKARLAQDTKNHFVTSGKKKYLVAKDGSVYTGWIVFDNALYYANARGVLKRNKKTSEGIAFDSTGKARSSVAANLKITTMEVVASVTDSTMTKEQKLKACWDYVVSDKRFTYYQRTPDFKKKGWQKQEALTMLNTRAGNGYGFACAFAALASEIGYTPYVVAGRVSSKSTAGDGMSGHCWVIIDQKYYDPGAQFRGWWPGVYGLASYDIRNVIQYKVNFKKSA